MQQDWTTLAMIGVLAIANQVFADPGPSGATAASVDQAVDEYRRSLDVRLVKEGDPKSEPSVPFAEGPNDGAQHRKIRLATIEQSRIYQEWAEGKDFITPPKPDEKEQSKFKPLQDRIRTLNEQINQCKDEKRKESLQYEKKGVIATLQTMYEEMKKRLVEEHDSRLTKRRARITKAIAAVSKKHKLDMVIQQYSLVYPVVPDITDEVLKILRAPE
jgi:Skp family chaperone for outer membrane proteins